MMLMIDDRTQNDSITPLQIGRTLAAHQLEKIGVLDHGDNLQQYSSFTHMLNEMWSDNADAISMQYTGADFDHNVVRRLLTLY